LIEFGVLVLEKMFKKCQCISTFAITSLGEGQSPSFEQTQIPFSKDDLCKVWLKLAQWFWRRKFLNDHTPFLHFCDYLPFEEDQGPVLLKNLRLRLNFILLITL
jgi:hypothetical protein